MLRSNQSHFFVTHTRNIIEADKCTSHIVCMALLGGALIAFGLFPEIALAAVLIGTVLCMASFCVYVNLAMEKVKHYFHQQEAQDTREDTRAFYFARMALIGGGLIAVSLCPELALAAVIIGAVLCLPAIVRYTKRAMGSVADCFHQKDAETSLILGQG